MSVMLERGSARQSKRHPALGTETAGIGPPALCLLCLCLLCPSTPFQVMESWKVILGTGRMKIKIEDVRTYATERWGCRGRWLGRGSGIGRDAASAAGISRVWRESGGGVAG